MRKKMLLLGAMAVAAVIVLLAIAIRVVYDSGNPSTHTAVETPGETPPSVITPPCGTVKTTSTTGYPVSEGFLAEVTTVHDAACRRDYTGLLAAMSTPFGMQGRQPADVLAELRANDGAPLVILAQTLEVVPIGGQGLIYCHPNGATATFARDTLVNRGGWSSFSLTGDEFTEVECFEAKYGR